MQTLKMCLEFRLQIPPPLFSNFFLIAIQKSYEVSDHSWHSLQKARPDVQLRPNPQGLSPRLFKALVLETLTLQIGGHPGYTFFLSCG